VKRRYGVSPVAIRRGERVLAVVSDKEKLEEGDVLVVLGPVAGIESLAGQGTI